MPILLSRGGENYHIPLFGGFGTAVLKRLEPLLLRFREVGEGVARSSQVPMSVCIEPSVYELYTLELETEVSANILTGTVVVDSNSIYRREDGPVGWFGSIPESPHSCNYNQKGCEAEADDEDKLFHPFFSFIHWMKARMPAIVIMIARMPKGIQIHPAGSSSPPPSARSGVARKRVMRAKLMRFMVNPFRLFAEGKMRVLFVVTLH